MTSPSPARSKTITPSSGKLSAGRIVKTLLVRAILLLRTSSIHAAIELATCKYKKRS